MSILTQKEREGLEEVFLSIKSSKNWYDKLKLSLFVWVKIEHKSAPAGKIMDKLTKKFTFLLKDKKNLSK